MMKTTKTLLTAATVLVLLGLVLFAGAMAKNHWNLTKLGTKELETNSYPVTESFRDVRIETHTADVRFVPSEDGSCRVVCRETENEKHSVTVQNGVLQVRVKDSREKNWFFFTGFSTETPSITLYLPEKEYGALHIQENTGDVEVPADFRFASLDVTSDTGDVTVGASTPAEIRIQTSTGDIRLENLSAKALELSTSTGKVSVRSVTCSGDLRIRVSTGDAELSDLACAGLISEGSTGEIVLRNVIAAENPAPSAQVVV